MTVDKHTHELARPVPRARHPEPGRVRGHLPAAGGAARPLHGARVARLSERGRRGEMLLEHAERDRVLDLEPVAEVGEVLAAQAAAGGRPRQRGAAPLRRRRARRDARRPARGPRRLAARRADAVPRREGATPRSTAATTRCRTTSRRSRRLGARAPPAARRRARATRSAPAWSATPWTASRRSSAMRPLAVARLSGWGCCWRRATFDAASLYVPGVALIAARRRRDGVGRARGQRRRDRAPRRPAHGRRGGALPAAASRSAPAAAAAARRRAGRAAARLAGADRRPLVARGCGSTCASRAAGGGCSSPARW